MDGLRLSHLCSFFFFKVFPFLRSFHPVDIYADNVNSTEGLLRVLRRVQEIEGFGLLEHDRTGCYSLLLVDVSIYWRLFRLLYSYSGLAPIRHDLFLGFGFWHTYSYAHVPCGMSSDCQTLLDRPKLIQSTTFLVWMRLAYPNLRVN